jgi:peptidoglycan/xylan/chitin deacetylase (PgdA/CDA1 family)
VKTPRIARLLPLWLALCAALAACGVREPAAAPPRVRAEAVEPPNTAAPPRARAEVATPTAARPTPSPTAPPSVTPSPSPTATQGIAGYVGYRVKPGDTLASLAAAGGSDPQLLLSYNRLAATPQVGRELIIPRLDGRRSRLPAPGIMVIRGNTARPWVALTLDCGNTYGHMGPILDTLRAADVRLTFFLTGALVADSAELVRRMAAEGHELAHHSYAHPDYTMLSDAEVLFDLRRNEAVIRDILGPEATLRPYFRFPYGAYDQRTLELVLAEGYLPVHWSLDLLDALGEPKTPAFIVERVMARPAEELRGAVILGHCTGAVRKALPELITRLRAAGYELRTLTDVLGE